MSTPSIQIKGVSHGEREKVGVTVYDSDDSRVESSQSHETTLSPKPTQDPNDPLNWPSWKKHAILICVSLAAFAGDFGMSAGIPAIVLQSQEWNLTPVEANHPNNLFIVMIGVACLILMPMANFWGRAPVFFWSTISGMLFTLAATVSTDWPTYYAMRCLQGATQTLGQTFGLVVIYDMFFAHEHARKIGIWYAFYLVSPFAGPLFGNFIIADLADWRVVYWVVFGFSLFVVILTLIFYDETKYNRSIPIAQQPPRPQSFGSRMLRLLGIWQIQHHKDTFDGVLESFRKQVTTLFRPVVPITIVIYGIIFMWSVGINQSSALLLELPRAVGGYGLGPRAIGFMYFTPILATIFGEVFGHYYNDYLERRYKRTHNGLFAPEIRLSATFPMAVLMIPGLVLIGQTLENHLHWTGIIFGWGLYQLGVMVVSVATVAFIFDYFPERAGEVSALINCGRALLGFSVGYFQFDWGLARGFDVSFGVQAVIATVCFVGLWCVQRWCVKLR